MSPLELESDIFHSFAALALLRLARAKRLISAHRRHRLAHMRDAALAIEALEAAHRAFDDAFDSARRLAVLLDQERGEEARLAHKIRLELGDDETRQETRLGQS